MAFDPASLRFDEKGLIPAIAQDENDGAVLMMAWMNAEAVAKTLETGQVTYWSRSRQEFWIKGATSGDTLELIEARVNCEQNSILYLVRPKGEGACHTKEPGGQSRISCYYRIIDEGELKHAPYRPTWQGHDSAQG